MKRISVSVLISALLAGPEDLKSVASAPLESNQVRRWFVG